MIIRWSKTRPASEKKHSEYFATLILYHEKINKKLDFIY